MTIKEEHNLRGAPPEPVILATDTARKCGFALYRNGKVDKRGMVEFSRMHDKKYSQTREWITEAIDRYKITVVVAEEIYPGDKSVQKELRRHRAVIEQVCKQRGVTFSIMSIREHKAHLTGNEHCNKVDTQRALRRLGYSVFKSDDESDALSILITYCDKNGISITHKA